MFSNFEYYIKIKKFLYPNQESVEFDKILRSECKIRKENYFVEEKFSISFGIYSSIWAFLRNNFVQKYVLSIFHEIWEIFKKYYQQNRSISLFLNINLTLNLELSFWEWNIILYLINENVNTWKILFARKKIPYKIEKISSTKKKFL